MHLDPVDIRILEALQGDGRLSFRELSKVAGVTTPTVSGRVATLTQLGLIRGFNVDLDAETLEEVTILLDIECRPSDVDDLGSALEGLPEVRELFVVDGTRLSAKVTVLDMHHLNRFLDRLGQEKSINNYRYSTITRTVKELPRAMLDEGLKVTIDCYYCRKPIVEQPVKLKMDGKDHYLCCDSCRKLYQEKYERIKRDAGRKPHPHELHGEHPESSNHGHHGHHHM